ncbi:hypothetical protein AV530_003033 [Patagioenas fasciata monilis]|uniref:Uncharacterized protein n=1 Tax=Patagioenas fasciata monilis TaxID=372326 RepID=A0A1V4KVM6_PATFA|nr:hypothetical protein AV530_003033 [Patagioenas fasciata monilis]
MEVALPTCQSSHAREGERQRKRKEGVKQRLFQISADIKISNEQRKQVAPGSASVFCKVLPRGRYEKDD